MNNEHITIEDINFGMALLVIGLVIAFGIAIFAL